MQIDIRREHLGHLGQLQQGPIGHFLHDKIHSNADLSFVSAYFTIYAEQATDATDFELVTWLVIKAEENHV